MKKSIHPEHRFVVFKDMSCEFSYLTKSTVKTADTIEHSDGKTYPLVKVEVSSQSHPFYTGQNRLLDTEGRAERFRKKYASRSKSSSAKK